MEFASKAIHLKLSPLWEIMYNVKDAVFRMWRRVHFVRTDVSEVSVASIFTVEKYASEKSVRRLLTDC
jgi:hypothetical protein